MKSNVVVAVIVCGAGVSACELFSGDIACKDDGDCPADRQFCVAGKCSADEDDGRNGRDVDNGACESDDDCADVHGLCDIDGSFAEAHTCLPPDTDATANCGDNPDVIGGGEPLVRSATGPVIFLVDATPIGDGCYSDVLFEHFEREPQPITNGFIELVAGGSPITIGGPGEGSNERSIFLQSLCGATPGKPAGIIFDLGGQSNVGCLPVAQ